MNIDAAEFLDPDDFEITPRTETNVRRALSGKVYGTRLIRRDTLEISYGSMSHAKLEALTSALYEQTAFGSFDLFFKRASSSDILDCTNAFKGVVEYIDTEQDADVDPQYSRNITFKFLVHSYEAF